MRRMRRRKVTAEEFLTWQRTGHCPHKWMLYRSFWAFGDPNAPKYYCAWCRETAMHIKGFHFG